jgi:hypothetical protein
MGFMGMHEWMACLQQGTLAPGLGLGLDQPNLHLAQPPLDDDLITPNSTKNKPKQTPNQSPSIHTQL